MKKKIKDIEELIPKQEKENQRNIENYDNLLQSARLNFQNELTKLAEVHKSENSNLEKKLAGLNDEFVKKIQDSVGSTVSKNVNQDDASVLKAR